MLSVKGLTFGSKEYVDTAKLGEALYEMYEERERETEEEDD